RLSTFALREREALVQSLGIEVQEASGTPEGLKVFAYAVKLRWPDGEVFCPRRSSEKNSFVKTRKL
ncbi:MAG TPA: hypothetical protein VNX60_02690, partial [Candidatus Acidoferrum sp.]|nr:hypothetical protein [Candidatus Acidoferrum sp.]